MKRFLVEKLLCRCGAVKPNRSLPLTLGPFIPSIGSSVTLVTLGFSSVIAVVENSGVQHHAGFSSWI